jgi:hypothetical protein
MFTDEKTLTVIHADLNESVIQATLRAQDLIPAFLYVIKDTPEYIQIMFNPIPFIPSYAMDDDDDEWWESEDCSYILNESLIDVLNNYAPDGYYFGGHEGNSSDFGYWELTEN